MSSEATSGSKYTRETGPGYAGIYSVGKHSAELSVCTHAGVNWTEHSDVVAVDDPTEFGVQLLERSKTDLDVIDEVPVAQRRSGRIACVRSKPLAVIDAGNGDDIRVYRRDAGLTLVLASDDPFVDGGGGR